MNDIQFINSKRKTKHTEKAFKTGAIFPHDEFVVVTVVIVYLRSYEMQCLNLFKVLSMPPIVFLLQ